MHGLVTFADVLHVKFRLCFALLVQISFNLLNFSFAYKLSLFDPSFFAFFRFVSKAVFLLVSAHCNLNVIKI